jgi:hypothetical protein
MRTASSTNLRASAAAQDRTVPKIALAEAINRFLESGAGARMGENGSIVFANGEAFTLANLLDDLPSAPQKKSKAKSAKDIKPADYTKPFMDFIDSSPTVFHAVSYFSKRLEGEGFIKLSERDSWKGKLQKGGKYYTTRNGSSILAFSIPTEYVAGNGVGTYFSQLCGCSSAYRHVAMAAGHIDALTARLKPVSKKPSTAGYTMLGVAPYAGGMNSTWWDRYVLQLECPRQ